MLRAALIATAIILGAGLQLAYAQNGGDCTGWCRANRCSGGMTAGAAPQCMNQCVAACQAKSKKK